MFGGIFKLVANFVTCCLTPFYIDFITSSYICNIIKLLIPFNVLRSKALTCYLKTESSSLVFFPMTLEL